MFKMMMIIIINIIIIMMMMLRMMMMMDALSRSEKLESRRASVLDKLASPDLIPGEKERR